MVDGAAYRPAGANEAGQVTGTFAVNCRDCPGVSVTSGGLTTTSSRQLGHRSAQKYVITPSSTTANATQYAPRKCVQKVCEDSSTIAGADSSPTLAVTRTRPLLAIHEGDS